MEEIGASTTPLSSSMEYWGKKGEGMTEWYMRDNYDVKERRHNYG